MQRELDKMESSASKIVEQAKLPSSTAKKLVKEVKVCMYYQKRDVCNVDKCW